MRKWTLCCAPQELFDEYLKKKSQKKSESSQLIDATCLKWTPHVKRWQSARRLLFQWTDCF